jgi:hypothetical protein
VGERYGRVEASAAAYAVGVRLPRCPLSEEKPLVSGSPVQMRGHADDCE